MSKRSGTEPSEPGNNLSSESTEGSKLLSQQSSDRVKQTREDVLSMVRQLQNWSSDFDSKLSRTAFEALTALLDDLLAWLLMSALFHEASLGKLLRETSSDEAWERYIRGEHVGAWAGVKLARLYKRFKAELQSRSMQSINPLRELRLGLQLGNIDSSPNDWFCAEYESKADYRPTGQMAVWIARKIEEVRLLKQLLLRYGLLSAVLQSPSKTEEAFPNWFRRPALVTTEAALKQLNNLPPFGGSNDSGFESWRRFLRYQLLTQSGIVKEFGSLFPNEDRNLDGALTATLRSAWRATQSGGRVVFPALRAPCK
jgi:hypothetical protein